MTNTNPLLDTVKIRISSEEKALLKQHAKEIGLTMSDLIRAVLFSQKKLVFLTQGAEIAKGLFQIHTDLERLDHCGGCSAEALSALTGTMKSVTDAVQELIEKLSDIQADDEEADTDA